MVTFFSLQDLNDERANTNGRVKFHSPVIASIHFRFSLRSLGFLIPLPAYGLHTASRYPSSVVSHDGLRRAAEPPEVVNGAMVGRMLGVSDRD